MSEGQPPPRRSIEDQPDWHTTANLLEAGQYEQVAELLGEAQATSQQRGDADLAQILAAAQRISLNLQRLAEFMEACISLPNHPATDNPPDTTSHPYSG